MEVYEAKVTTACQEGYQKVIASIWTTYPFMEACVIIKDKVYLIHIYMLWVLSVNNALKDSPVLWFLKELNKLRLRIVI